MADWNFQLAGQTLGPVAARQLAEMALDGRLQSTDLVHRADKIDWVEASRVQGLRFSPLGPPPVPKTPRQPTEPVQTATSGVAPRAAGVMRRVLLETRAVAAATLRHMCELWRLASLEMRSRSVERGLCSARIAAGRELFEQEVGQPEIIASIRSTLEKSKAAAADQSKAIDRELDREYARLAVYASPQQLMLLSVSERLVGAHTAVAAVRAELLGQWQAVSVFGAERRRVFVGYGTTVATIICFAVLLSSSLASSNRRSSVQHAMSRDASSEFPQEKQKTSPEPPAGSRTVKQRETPSTPKTAARVAYENLETLFYEEAATPFVLSLVVITRMDEHTYEIGLPWKMGDQRAMLRTTDTVFNSKGRAQIAALGDGSREIQTKDGFKTQWPAYKEALSETGAYVLSVKEAHAMQEDVAKRIKRAEEELVDALLADGYKGTDVANLKTYLNVDIDPQLLNQSLIDNRLRSVQREVEKRRPSG